MINEEYSQELFYDFDFTFDSVRLANGDMLKLHKNLKKFDGGFVNFERVYDMQGGVMFRLAMGSFDRPENLFVIVKDKKAHYFPIPPLKSKSNLEAHKLLNKVLHG